MIRTARLLAPFLALALALPGSAAGQYDRAPLPAAYALRGVTVVQADGRRSEGVNLVVRNGLVETLGGSAPIPADAEVLRGDGLFVYPGLVDGQGHAEVDFPEAMERPGEDGVEAWDPTRSRSGFVPHRRVAHHLSEAGAGLKEERRKGIVASLVHPAGGMAPGQPAVLVHRVDARAPWELVDVESAGLTLGFQSARGVYPSQLFGVIAYLRQAFMDAARWARMRSTYARDPRGMLPPPWDPDYEALVGAVRDGSPVYFHAGGDDDIRRALALADTFGFRPVILGGDEAWKLADELARREVPVLVAVDFAPPREWSEEDSLPAAELEPGALRERERIEAARANPGRLERAGVTFALTSGGGMADLLEGARTAVENGLSREAALRALTSTPARLLGVPALARVEEGLAASFMVTDGELFDHGTEVVYTFVEGRLERAEEEDDR